MSILTTGLNLAGKGVNLLRKSVLCTKPQNVTNINLNRLKYVQNTGEDVFELKNTATRINLQLKNLYNIESEISNPEISKRVLSTVEDYCNVNKNNNLFKGAKLKQDFLKDIDNPSTTSWDYNTKDISITFNENFDWKNLKQISQNLYDDCQIPTNHPNFYVYRDCANILNFKHNPYAFHYSNSREFVDKSELCAYRLNSTSNVLKFNSSYVAARMSKKKYPRTLQTFFEENGGNTNLRFPKPIPDRIIQGSIHHFKNQKDAINYLTKNYGIDGNFIDTHQANLFAGAVDDLSKALGSNEYFRGLKVSVDPTRFENTLTKMMLSWDYATGKAELFINPAYNWRNIKKLNLSDYNNLFHPTTNPKDTYIHELAHWLDFKGNPNRFGETEIAFSSGKTYYNNVGKMITAKVSSYAPKSPGEFAAEYICARMNGIKFPKAVDKEFEADWNGPVLNFPD